MLYGVEFGSESNWSSLSGPEPLSLANETYQYLVFHNPQWDYKTFDPVKDVAVIYQVVTGTGIAEGRALPEFLTPRVRFPRLHKECWMRWRRGGLLVYSPIPLGGSRKRGMTLLGIMGSE